MRGAAVNDPKNFEFKPGGIIEVQHDGHTELYAGSNAKWWLEQQMRFSGAAPLLDALRKPENGK